MSTRTERSAAVALAGEDLDAARRVLESSVLTWAERFCDEDGHPGRTWLGDLLLMRDLAGLLRRMGRVGTPLEDAGPMTGVLSPKQVEALAAAVQYEKHEALDQIERRWDPDQVGLPGVAAAILGLRERAKDASRVLEALGSGA
jgi:hypothetical protein